MNTCPELRIRPERLWNSLMSLATIGATAKGGVCRLALTELDRVARDQFVAWAKEAGCSVRVDAIGNLFARREGAEAGRRAVATGSHIDTQPTGGKFDGNFGVLAGLEVLRTLQDHGIRTRAPIEVCVWTNEEGSRFVPVMMGSGVFAGAFSLDHALNARDREGVSVGEALQAIGYQGTAHEHEGFEAYFEAHIEQGPILEATGHHIGAVTGALGQRWYDVVVTGQEAHAGPTPMDLRRDALMEATSLMQEVRRIAMDEQPDARGTVGFVQVHPNSRNVIPGRVTFTVDFRHAHDEGLMRMDGQLRQAVAQLEAQGRVKVSLEEVVYFPPARFDAKLVGAVREGARRLGQEPLDIVSGAGHDAVYVARVAPTAMIFVPCKDGISHNEIEDAQPEHLALGADVLLKAMLDIAGVVTAN